MTDLGGGRDSLPCIVCRKDMRRIMDGGYELQPDDGLHFQTFGAYGTTVFDPMDGSTLDVIICDECIVKAAKDGIVLLTQSHLPVKDEDEVYAGYVYPEREPVPWDPDKEYESEEPLTVSFEEIAEGRVTPYAMLKAESVRKARSRVAEWLEED